MLGENQLEREVYLTAKALKHLHIRVSLFFFFFFLGSLRTPCGHSGWKVFDLPFEYKTK